MSSLHQAFDALASKRLLLFGGKGGVGKTTISSLAALHYAGHGPVILFTTDPASNLGDLFADESPENLRVEQLDAGALYQQFLRENLSSFLEIGDRGTYLDRQEMRRLFELSLPGVDELMGWMRAAEIAEQNQRARIIVDTAPTGHTLRMLASGEHFQRLAAALEAMQEKHRGLVRQLTRRESRDAIDEFIARFEGRVGQRRSLLRDAESTAFVPVMLSEPWVVQQTRRLIDEIRQGGVQVPLVILNRVASEPDCPLCAERAEKDRWARTQQDEPVFDAPRACFPLDSVSALRRYLERGPSAERQKRTELSESPAGGGLLQIKERVLFFAGKGGVGKTTIASSAALQLAKAHPQRRFTILSVDPAHALRDVFAEQEPPSNLTVEAIDTRAKWQRLRENLGGEIERAMAGLTPQGLSVAYDTEAMQKLIEIAPPGADELFAVDRIAELIADSSQACVLVDTAPTGHFLRLLELPRTAGDWVREFMRILLRYRELIPAGSLGAELVKASRALKTVEETLQSPDAAVVVVTRPERLVLEETGRLIAELNRRGVAVSEVVANYVTPVGSDCPCDRAMRSHERAALRSLQRSFLEVNRQPRPVTDLDELARLFRVASDSL